MENEGYKILWEFTIQYDTRIEAGLPGIVIIDKIKKEVKIVDCEKNADYMTLMAMKKNAT